MKRSELRENIFLLVFRVEFNSMEEMPEQVKVYFEELEQPVKDKDEEYIEQKTAKIFSKLPEIDAMINEKAEGWNASRMERLNWP